MDVISMINNDKKNKRMFMLSGVASIPSFSVLSRAVREVGAFTEVSK